MLKVLVLLTLMVPVGAAAQPEADLETEWFRAHYECRMGETREGEVLVDSVVEESCWERENIAYIMISHGHCWSSSEQEWFAPEEDGALCENLWLR